MIKFNYSDNLPPLAWTMPDKCALEFAAYVKLKYPKLWAKSGNLSGNDMFKKLSEVSDRGYWLKEEQLFYKKWQLFINRHKKSSTIESVLVNLKSGSFGVMGENQVKKLIKAQFIKSV